MRHGLPATRNTVGDPIRGGVGVGTVTRPGTGIPVGDPAITRVPKRMILQSLEDAAAQCGLPDGMELVVEISVPNGVEIAKKTTNSRLGILDGISILGSTGVVQPYSTAAWRASVHLAIDVAAANDLSHLVLTTGTRSEAFAKQRLDLPDMAYIEAGIFSGHSMKRCVMRQVGRATHAGMVGKFSKMAMGYFVTHVAGNQVDTSFLARLAAECGASPKGAGGDGRGRQRPPLPGDCPRELIAFGVSPDVPAGLRAKPEVLGRRLRGPDNRRLVFRLRRHIAGICFNIPERHPAPSRPRSLVSWLRPADRRGIGRWASLTKTSSSADPSEDRSPSGKCGP